MLGGNGGNGGIGCMMPGGNGGNGGMGGMMLGGNGGNGGIGGNRIMAVEYTPSAITGIGGLPATHGIARLAFGGLGAAPAQKTNIKKAEA